MNLDPQFLVRLQGRDFVLFAGLMDAAHRAGLQSIVTTPIQIPSAENGHLAVMKARVEMTSGQVYEAIGDASPESVGRAIAPHLLRMAETRSIGRALRWALNITVTMREELGEGTPQAELPPADERRERAPAPVSAGSRDCEGCGCELTGAQSTLSLRKYGQRLCHRCQKTAAVVG